jgi:hypothetical protein
LDTEIFPDHVAVHEYAEANGFAYVWEGTAAFEKRLQLLSPDQYELLAVHTRKGVKRVMLFSKAIVQAESNASELDKASQVEDDLLIAAGPATLERELERRWPARRAKKAKAGE